MVVSEQQNRLDSLFRKRGKNLLSIYYTAGFPAMDDTVRIGQLLEESKVDLIEIGIPFSDPVADGPVIQASNKTALDNGMTLKLLLGQVRELRKKIKTPILLMGYFNPILQFGVEKFCMEASKAGVDGLIIPDLPLAEYQALYSYFDENGLKNIFLIAPTTSDDRIKAIDEASDGFIYAVSSSNTTGAKNNFSPEQLKYFERLKKMDLKNPMMIGFGVSNNETFSTACQYSAGAIVGSAFIAMLRETRNIENDIPKFVGSLKGKN